MEIVPDFFDIEDLLDISNDDIAAPIIFSSSNNNNNNNTPSCSSCSQEDDDSLQLLVPPDCLAELDWLPKFTEEEYSFSDSDEQWWFGNTGGVIESYQSRSPVSVLENRCGSGSSKPRSKRRRRVSSINSTRWNASVLGGQGGEPGAKEPEHSGGGNPAKSWRRQSSGLGRRCLHCASEKTPQWRAGPLGPKTLCNACGVRYKSGRLLPEYRPASSPTFLHSVHSNSHKKVLELRRLTPHSHVQEGAVSGSLAQLYAGGESM